jgi:prostaglandin-H2 D-isomerase / glutathione transferase
VSSQVDFANCCNPNIAHRFQVLHDEELGKGDMKGLKEYPRLAKLADAVRNRPNVKAFLNSPEYKG